MYCSVLDCSERKTFWLSWAGDSIQAGRGALYKNRIINWKDPNPIRVFAVSLFTDNNQYGYWEVAKNSGKIIFMHG